MAASSNPARRRLSAMLNREIPIVLILGAVAWLLPGTASRVAGWAMVAFLILTPIVRVGWLAARWMRFDRRFAWTAWGLLLVVGAAACVAVLVR